MNTPVTIGTIQLTCSASTDGNMSHTMTAIREAASQGAQIICLQELFRSLYFCNTEDHQNFALAEPIPGPTVHALQQIAKELQIVLIASLFEQRAPGLYHNTAAVIDADGSYLGCYRKAHIPDDPGFYEKFYFTPGDTGYRVFETRYAKIGVLICWDQWYPEAARITSLMGAEIIFYPTAIGWDTEEKEERVNTEQYDAWQTIQKAHAIANGVHVVSVNRTGQESGTRFWGGSFISNPFGSILYQASHDTEEIRTTCIDLSSTGHYRTVWPFLRDRRIDTYAPITERFIDSGTQTEL